jgi:leader peptidase (prepilin peptidase)/N-methyltransferase
MSIFSPSLLNDPGFIGLAVVVLFLLGPCLGSFASAIAYRAPRGLSWVSDKGKGARSACPHCGSTLKIIDLVPVLSWVMLRGKCRKCQARVSALYPALEIAALLISLALLYQVGIGITLLVGLLALPFLLALNVIAWEGFPLPRQLVIIVFSLGLLLMVLSIFKTGGANLETVIISSLVGMAVFSVLGGLSHFLRVKIFKRQGDVTVIGFLAVTGMWFGAVSLPGFLIVAGLSGILLAAARAIFKRPQVYIMPNAYTAAFVIILVFGGQIMPLLLR